MTAGGRMIAAKTAFVRYHWSGVLTKEALKLKNHMPSEILLNWSQFA